MISSGIAEILLNPLMPPVIFPRPDRGGIVSFFDGEPNVFIASASDGGCGSLFSGSMVAMVTMLILFGSGFLIELTLLILLALLTFEATDFPLLTLTVTPDDESLLPFAELLADWPNFTLLPVADGGSTFLAERFISVRSWRDDMGRAPYLELGFLKGACADSLCEVAPASPTLRLAIKLDRLPSPPRDLKIEREDI